MADDELKRLLSGMISTNQQLIENQKQEISKLNATLESVNKQLELVQKQKGSGSASGEQCRSFEALANIMESFVYDPDHNLSFEAWYDRYSDVFINDAAALGEGGKVRLLLMKLETSANERYRHSILPLKPKDVSFDLTVTKLKALFKKKMSIFRSRWTCLQVAREPDEDLAAYGARVNKLSEDFQLSALKADQFKVLVFILGLRDAKDKNIKTRMLNLLDKTKAEDTLLQTMVEEAERLTEIERDSGLSSHIEQFNINQLSDNNQPGQFNANQLSYNQPGQLGQFNVNQLSNNQQGQFGNNYNQHSRHNNRRYRNNNNQHSGNRSGSGNAPRTPCWKCGVLHYVKDCDYKEHKCTKCNVVGHREGYCNALGNRPSQNINIVQLTVNQTADQASDNRKYIEVYVNKVKLVLQYDTGSDITILSEESWMHIGSPPLSPSACRPADYNSNPVKVFGELLVCVELKGVQKMAQCIVTNRKDLFGSDWATLYNLWDLPATSFCNQVTVPIDSASLVVELQQKFAPVFEKGLGECQQFRASLQLKPDAHPVFRQKRPVPFHVMALVTEELERLEQSGIISPVQFSSFAAPIVVVKKSNGKIRLVGDYSTGLNDMLQSHEYPVPTPEDIFASLSNCELFSQIDLSDAYLQVVADDESRKLMTINTHKGLFAFNRLCPGVKPAAGIFQQIMETVLAGIEGVKIYFDDLLISSATIQQHRSTLFQVFERLEKFNLKVRFEKCNFLQREVKYLGVIVNAKGQRPDPAKVESIISMPPPSNISQARAFLGAIGFYTRFIKSMSTIRSPIDKLMRKDEPFVWSEECDQAFNQFKKLLTSDLLLTHYDPRLPIMIAADASSTGIGCVAYHTYADESVKAFHHASRRLSQAEQSYSQIEKEGLAIIFAVKKFHKYIWGRRFTIFTDHRPLLVIFGSNKGVPVHTANRLQRWAIILIGYDFAIKFIGTDDFGHADILSRLIADRPPSQEDIIIANITAGEEVNIIEGELSSFSPVSFDTIRAETLKDDTLTVLKEYTTSKWPHKSTIKSMEVLRYFNVKDELQIINDVVIYRDRTVVPPSCRQRILCTLHKAHPGIVRMKSLARCFVFWPGIDAAIEQLASTCMSCQQALKAPTKTCLSAWPTPSHPWFRAHADFAGPINNLWYFIIVDAYTKWPEVFTMSTTTASATTSALMELCARFGSMNKLVTDNGPQFTSGIFKDFCERESIDHIRTAPYMPMSNGLAERFVDTFKTALVKSRKYSNDNIQEFLRTYRATPNSRAPFGKSPAELMFGRRMRLPISIVLPPVPPPTTKNTAMEDAFNKKHGAVPRSFKEEEEVILKLHKNAEWEKATVIEPVGSVMYNILMNGRVRRVHANQLRSVAVTVPEFPAEILDEPLAAPASSIEPPPQRRQRTNWRAVTRDSPPKLRPRN